MLFITYLKKSQEFCWDSPCFFRQTKHPRSGDLIPEMSLGTFLGTKMAVLLIFSLTAFTHPFARTKTADPAS